MVAAASRFALKRPISIELVSLWLLILASRRVSHGGSFALLIASKLQPEREHSRGSEGCRAMME